MHKIEKRQLRKDARDKYTATLTTCFSSCEYCKITIIWWELVDSNILLERTDRIVTILEDWIPIKYEAATIEHIISLKQGGSNLLENLSGACAPCNNEKGLTIDKGFPMKRNGRLIKAKNHPKLKLK